MTLDLSAQIVTFTCPRCKRETDKTFEWARKNTEFACPCGNVSSFDNTQPLKKPPEPFLSKFETTDFSFVRR